MGVFKYLMSSVQRKMLVSFSVIMVIVVFVAAVTYYQLNRVQGHAEDVVPTSHQISAQEHYGTRLSALETDLERFLVTGSVQIAGILDEDLEQLDAAFGELAANDTGVETEVSTLQTVHSGLLANVRTLLNNATAMTSRERNEAIVSAYESIDRARTVRVSIEEATLSRLRNSSEQQQDIVNSLIVLFIVMASVTAAATLIIALTVARHIANPVRAMAQAASRIAAGDFDVQVPIVGRRDELGQLATTFNAMANQLQGLVGSLESRVEARTRDLFLTLEVGQLASRIYRLEELLPRITEYVRDQFGLYYTQVYLNDDAERYTVLVSGTGEVGRQLLDRKHRLDLRETSIVARAVQSKRPVLVANTEASDLFKSNPLLPETRSEVAIPLIVGDDVIGVLDMQAHEADTFRDDNLAVFEAMASQLASAIRSAQAYTETEQAIERATAINRRLTFEAWQSYLGRVGQGVRVGYRYDLQKLEPLTEPVEVAPEAAASGNGHRSQVVRPVKVGTQVIGKIALAEDQAREWTSDDLDLIDGVADRVALALEQYRAFDETRVALDQVEESERQFRAVFENANDAIFLLRPEDGTFVDWNSRTLDYYGASVADLQGKTPGDFSPETQPDGNNSNAKAAELITAAAAGEPQFFEWLHRRNDGSEFYADVSLNAVEVGGKVFTQAVIRDITERREAEAERERLLADTEDQAQRLALLNQMATDISAADTMDAVYRAVAQYTDRILHSDRSSVALIAPDGEYFEIFGLDGVQGTIPMGAKLPVEGTFIGSVVAHGRLVYVDDMRDYDYPELKQLASQGLVSTMSVPLIVGERVIGTLNVGNRQPDAYSMRDQGLLVQIGSLVASNIETYRLLDETRQRALEMQTVAQVGAEASATLEPESLLWSMVDLTKERFNLYHAHVYLLDASGETLVLRAGADEAGRKMVSAGHRIGMGHERSLVARAGRTRDTVVVDDVTASSAFLPNPLLPMTRSEMAIPMVVGNELIGVLDVQSSEVAHFTDADRQVQETLASQIAVAVNNARQYSEAQRRAVEMETVAQVGSEASAALDPNQLLWDVVELTKERFGLYHAHIYLLDDSGQRLNLAAGAGEPGRMMAKHKHNIAVSRETSIVARAARTGEPVIENDVTHAPEFLANPLLPETRAEMAVPMIVGDRVIGVLDVQSTQVGRFTQEDARVQGTLASQIAVAVNNARLFEETQNSQQLLRTIIDTSPDWIFAKDTGYRYLLVNDSFAEFYGGRSPEEMEGLDDYDLGTPVELIEGDPEQNIVGFRVDDRKVIEEGRTVFNPNDIVEFADGSRHIYETTKLPLRDREGNVIGMLGLGRDVTERRLAQQQREQLYETNRELVGATDYQGILDAVAHHSQRYGAVGANLLDFDLDETGAPIWTEVLATAVFDADAFYGSPIGSRYYLPDFPFAKLWLADMSAPQLISDVMNDPRVDEQTRVTFQHSGVSAAVLLPLTLAGRAIGMAIFSWSEPREFTELDEQYYRSVVGPMASVLESRRLFDRVEHTLQETELLYNASRHITEASDAMELVKAVTEAVPVAGVNRALLLSYEQDDAGDAVVAHVLANWYSGEGHPPTEVGRTYDLNIFPTFKLALQPEPVFFTDTLSDGRIDPATRKVMEMQQIHSMAALPLWAGGRQVGSLFIESQEVHEFTEDEVRPLTSLAAQMAVALDSLQLLDQAQRRALEMQTVSELGAEAASSLDPNQLLQTVCDLAKERFGLYHTHVYLLDEERDMLMLAAGAGSAGRMMASRGHRIPVSRPNSLVARAARTGEPVVVNDVTQAADYLPNPMLPRTKSEMAIPLVVGDTLVGVLDVQADEVNHFTAHDRIIQSTLASQVAVAVNNANLYREQAISAQQRQALNDLSVALLEESDITRAYQMVVDTLVDRFDMASARIWTVDDKGVALVLQVNAGDDINPDDGQLSVALDSDHKLAWIATNLKPYLTNNVGADPTIEDPEWVDEMGLQAFAGYPLMAGDRLLAVVSMFSRDALMDETQLVLQSMATQVGMQIRTQMLFDETQRRASEMETVARVSMEASTSLEVDKLLQDVADLTRDRFDLYHAHIYLLDDAGQNLVLAAGAGDAGRLMASRGHRIPVNRQGSLVARAAREQTPIVVNDVRQANDFLPNPLLPRTRAEMAIPMIVGRTLIGVLDVQSDAANIFTEEDVRVKGTLATQAAVAVNNARLFAEQVETAERLREVDRLKSEFLASMSHELRTPLNSIIGYAEVLLDGIDGDLTEDMDEDVTAIHGSGKHLLNLINDILDLAKIEAGQMDLVTEPLALRALVEDMASTTRVLLKNKPVDLVIDVPEDLPLINADPLRLRQVISNLMTNASKFTEEGSITVWARPYDKDPNMIHVGVTDTGIGMNEEQVAVIFDRFRQVDQSHTRRAGGTGLGLSITLQLIQMHGGDIWVESEPGTGSTFNMTLPLATTEEASA